jgi:hypothetical protein
MWVIGLYLLIGIMVWIVYDKAAVEQNVEPSDARGMLTLIGLWPIYIYSWFTNRDYDDGS